MSEELVIRHCSPTLAGLKTGNLFTCPFATWQDLRESTRQLNRKLIRKGVRVLPLRYSQQRALMYLYRPARLKRDFTEDRADGLLRRFGYACDNPDRCVVQLIRKLESSSEFPHEIGLFLGYPPEDVIGFIENQAGGCKCSGFWKVYGDVEQAQKTFARFKKCTDVYYRQWSEGKPIERLTVAAG